jgi:hypothetical protein
VIAYRATADVSRELAWFLAKLLAERRRRGTPRGSRALTCFWQAVLGLRWFRERTTPDALARDHRISRATAYRYLDEVIAVLTGEAPELRGCGHYERRDRHGKHARAKGIRDGGDPCTGHRSKRKLLWQLQARIMAAPAAPADP